jgi:hypothetical protein
MRMQVRTITQSELVWRPLSSMRAIMESELGHPPGAFEGARVAEPSQPLTPGATSPSAATAAQARAPDNSVYSRDNICRLLRMQNLRDSKWFYVANGDVQVRAILLEDRVSQHLG